MVNFSREVVTKSLNHSDNGLPNGKYLNIYIHQSK